MTIQLIKVLIVDDHPGVRAGIKKLLLHAKDIVVVGEGANGVDAIQLARSLKPDIMLLDVELPEMRGEEVARHIRDNQPEVKILAVSSYDDRLYIQAMMENGARGFITKDEAPKLLLEAVYGIITGEANWVSPRASRHARQVPPNEMTFTTREMDILRQLTLKKSKKEISHSLKMDEKRLTKYIQFLQAKFGVESLADLRRAARRFISSRKSEQK